MPGVRWLACCGEIENGMRYLLLSTLLMIWGAGCAVETSHVQQEVSVAKAQEVPKPSPEPLTYQKQHLSRNEVRTLNDLLPASARKVLEQAEEIELLSIVPCGQGYMPSPERNEPGKFQGCTILKKAVITDVELKRQLLDALYDGVAKTTGGMGCFSPRHGIRVSYKGNRVDLVICFECHIFSGLNGSERIGGSISNLPEEFFNQILKSAGVTVDGK
jgi:hypothetical protein